MTDITSDGSQLSKVPEPQADDDQRVDPGEDVRVPKEFLEGLPPETRREVVRAFTSFSQYLGPVYNPVLKQVTSEHVGKLIDHAEAESKREFEGHASERRYNFAYFLVGLIAILILVGTLIAAGKDDILPNLIGIIASFAGGFGLGKSAARQN